MDKVNEMHNCADCPLAVKFHSRDGLEYYVCMHRSYTAPYNITSVVSNGALHPFCPYIEEIEEKECPECYGMGKVYTNEINDYDEEVVMRSTCQKCRGEGIV